MTTTYLGFLMNRTTREEFVAPVNATSVDMARMELFAVYPDAHYALLTVYTKTEIEHVLAGVERWPGLPSKIQKPVEVKSAPVRISTGGLPPLPGQVTATVQKVDATTDTTGMPGWMKSFVQQQEAATKSAAKVAAKPAAVQPMEAAIFQPKSSMPPASLIERLKAAKGETMARPSVSAPAFAPQAPTAKGSVIDILKGMKK